MENAKPFYFGNAAADQIRNTGWFIGQFVPPELGLRHQRDVEVEWGFHPDRDKRPSPWANGNGTTISVLIRGTLHICFHTGGAQETVTLTKEGDYVIYGPDIVHSWEASGETLVISVRFPSVEIGRTHASRPEE